MKKILLLVFIVGLFSSCGTSGKVTSSNNSYKKEKNKVENPNHQKITKVVRLAKSYEGTPYKFGGTNNKGMDCSGLIYTCYLEENIQLPRTSKAMSEFGHEIKLKETNIGDLVFFETDKTRRKINHVGLVIDKKVDKIYFIHSTTSQGVIISTLDDYYWSNSFVMVRRIM